LTFLPAHVTTTEGFFSDRAYGDGMLASMLCVISFPLWRRCTPLRITITNAFADPSEKAEMNRDWTGDIRWALGVGSRLVGVASLSAIGLAIADPTALGELGLTLPRILSANVGTWLVASALCGLGRPYLSSLPGSALAGFIGGSTTAIAMNLADYRSDMTDLHKYQVLVFALIGTGSGIATYFRLKQRNQSQ
jgi:hypothetical protein